MTLEQYQITLEGQADMASHVIAREIETLVSIMRTSPQAIMDIADDLELSRDLLSGLIEKLRRKAAA